jgi:hypothetical protein
MKSKILITLVAVMFMTLLTSCKPKISGQIVTNWVKPSENLRIVNGQLYDSDHSELWKNPLELAGLHQHANENFRLLTYLAKIETVDRNKVLCGVYSQAHWPPVANGEVESEGLVQKIVIYHYPNAESLVSGQYLANCRCMRVANYNDNGISYAAFDCGVQSTELVPEINGTMVKVGGVQIVLIDAKEASDFLQKKKTESDQKSAQIQTVIDKLETELNTNQAEYEEAKNVASQSYTNDPQYIAAIKESDDAIKMAQTLANAIEYLRSKYGDSPYGRNPLVRQYPKEYYDAWHAEDADAARIQSIRQDANRIDNEINSLPQKIQNDRNLQINTAMAAVEETKQKLDEANQTLKSFQTAYFYLADFSPAALEMSLTDKTGNFVIHNPKPGTKIFAKVESDETNKDFFWLLDPPQKGDKLILSDTNLFTLNP